MVRIWHAQNDETSKRVAFSSRVYCVESTSSRNVDIPPKPRTCGRAANCAVSRPYVTPKQRCCLWILDGETLQIPAFEAGQLWKLRNQRKHCSWQYLSRSCIKKYCKFQRLACRGQKTVRIVLGSCLSSTSRKYQCVGVQRQIHAVNTKAFRSKKWRNVFNHTVHMPAKNALIAHWRLCVRCWSWIHGRTLGRIGQKVFRDILSRYPCLPPVFCLPCGRVLVQSGMNKVEILKGQLKQIW